MMTPYLSRKLRVLSALAIIMVIYIHMFYTEGETMRVLGIIERCVSGICSTAVPLFFAISGYLFFLKTPNGIESMKGKIRKRMRTLLVPYLLANVFTFFFYCILNLLAERISAIDSVLNFRVLDTVREGGLWPTLKLVFINPPIAFQLWFVRDLLVMVVFSPLIYLLLCGLTRLRNNGYDFAATGLIVVSFICYCFGLFPWFYFIIGGYIAMADIPVEFPRASRLAVPVLGVVLAAMLAMAVAGCSTKLGAKLIPPVGISLLWLLYDAVAHSLKRPVIDWFAKYTFFVYLIHEPVLNIFKKIPLLINRSECALICYYFLIPIIFYVLACLLGCWLSHQWPKLYKIYSGGR